MGGLQIDRVTTVPSWAAHLSLDRWRALLFAMQEHLNTRNVLARFEGDTFSVAFFDGRLARLGIANLAGRCRHADIEDFHALAREHIDAVLGPVAPPADARAPVPFDAVAPSLVAHVYREEMLRSPSGARVIARPLCAGLVTALAVDFGHCIGSLPPDLPAEWGRSHDELFRLALDNVRRRRVERHPFGSPRLPGFMLASEDHTVNSQVHFLGDHLGAHHPAGAIVALPTRRTLLCVPLRSGDARGSLERLHGTIGLVRDLFDEFAGRSEFSGEMFSPHLYWWRDGALAALPATVSPMGRVVMPPEAMLKVLLAAPTQATADA